MSATAISRMQEKLLKARGVGARVASGIEAEADALIAEEETIKAATTEAFAPHKALLGEAKTELQAIKDALNLMTNGGPPLSGAGITAGESPRAPIPPVTLNEAGVIPEPK